jgi:hypothetical protein
MTQTKYSYYTDDYAIVYRTNYSEDITIDFLNHLLIVHLRTQEDSKDENHELSL